MVRFAAVSTLRAISWVAAPCSVTAAAIAPLMSPILRIVRSMAPSASIERAVACCMPEIWALISSVALAVCPASALTSLATTAKPRPASPAPRGFYCGVERKQIRLFGNIVDQTHHIADPRSRLVELLDHRICPFGLADGFARDRV